MAQGSRQKEGGIYEQFLAAQQGDRVALNELLATLRPEILAAVGRRVRSAPATQALAEELTQEALLRITEGLSGCRAGTVKQFHAWYWRIALNVVRDWYRRRSEEQSRRVGVQLSEALRRHPGETVQDREELKHGDERAVDELLGEILLEAQEVLSEGTQIVIRRRLLYGDSWQRAGEAAGTTAGGAKRRYQRAVVRLRKEVISGIRSVPDEDLQAALLRRIGE